MVLLFFSKKEERRNKGGIERQEKRSKLNHRWNSGHWGCWHRSARCHLMGPRRNFPTKLTCTLIKLVSFFGLTSVIVITWRHVPCRRTKVQLWLCFPSAPAWGCFTWSGSVQRQALRVSLWGSRASAPPYCSLNCTTRVAYLYNKTGMMLLECVAKLHSFTFCWRECIKYKDTSTVYIWKVGLSLEDIHFCSQHILLHFI